MCAARHHAVEYDTEEEIDTEGANASTVDRNRSMHAPGKTRQVASPGAESTALSPIKVSFNVAPHQVATLKELAAKRGVSMTEILRHAIALEAILDAELDDGSRLFIEDKKGKVRKELVLIHS